MLLSNVKEARVVFFNAARHLAVDGEQNCDGHKNNVFNGWPCFSPTVGIKIRSNDPPSGTVRK